MIRVTRINNKELVVNAELIEFLEKTPDSIISLTTGKKFAVVESIDEIIEKVIAYRAMINDRPKVRDRNSPRESHDKGIDYEN